MKIKIRKCASQQGGQFSDFDTNLVFFEGALCFFSVIFWRHNLVIFHCIWFIFSNYDVFLVVFESIAFQHQIKWSL